MLAAGTIAVGQWVQDATGAIAPGTIITGGSGSTWTVSVSQVVAPEPMTATILENEATVNIDQVPGISAANIQMITQA